MRKTFAVARFEFFGYATNMSFIVVTIILVLVAAIGPTIPTIINLMGGATPERNIVVVDATGWFSAEELDTYLSPSVSVLDNVRDDIFMRYASILIADGTYNYALEITNEGYTLLATNVGMALFGLQDQIAHMLRSRHRTEQLLYLGVESWRLESIMGFQPNAEVWIIEDIQVHQTGQNFRTTAADDFDGFFSGMVYSYVLSLVFYFGLMFGIQHLLATVMREKSTKTMEVLITAAKADHLLNGKVLGIAAICLGQLFLMSIVGMISIAINASFTFDIEAVYTVDVSSRMLGFMFIYFLLGYILYAYLCAALASTVNRLEDAGALVQLPTILILIAFMATIMGITNPSATWVTVFSHIPFFSPFVMFMRVSLDSAALWEVVLNFGIMVLSIVLIAFVGSRIYRMGTLMYGNKLRWRDIIQSF